jgi:hypothetical protein
MHVDEVAAENTPFKGLAASGWHTAAIAMNLAVQVRPFGPHPLIGLGVADAQSTATRRWRISLAIAASTLPLWPYQSDELSQENTAQHLGAADDCEEEACLTEPTLGSIEDHPSIFDSARLGKVAAHSQENWASGNGDDREGDPCCDDREGDEEEHGGDEHDGAEPDEDGEPSLGWTEAMAQGRGRMGDSSDREQCGPAARPQNRTEIEGPQIRAESSYRKMLFGLTDKQKPKFGKRMSKQDGTTSVVVR